MQDKLLLLLIYLLQDKWRHSLLRTDYTFPLRGEVIVIHFYFLDLFDGVGLATTADILLCLFLVDEQALRPATHGHFLRSDLAKCNLAVTAAYFLL